MNITSIANLYSSLQSNTAQVPNSLRMNATGVGMEPVATSTPTTSADRVQEALKRSSARLEGQQQTTEARISSYGQVKAGFARIEDAGSALAKNETLSSADTKKAMEALVSAYNETRSAAATTEPGRASNAVNALRRSAESDGMRADLQALGITQQRDGSLAFDTKKFDEAMQTSPDTVRAAAGQIGSQMQQSASRALSAGGAINATLNTLTTRSQQIESRQASLQALIDTQQQPEARNNNSRTQAGIASYQRMFSM